MISATLIATLLTLGASGYKVDPCGGCTRSLFQQSTNPDAQVGVDDIARLVVNEIDQDTLLQMLKDTVPESSSIDDLWGMPKIKAEMVTEKLRPTISDVIEDLVTAESETQEQVTSGVVDSVLFSLRSTVDKANKALDERREIALKQLTNSIINDMWAITSSKIRDSSMDTYNVNQAEYQALVEDLLPELAQATDLTDVKTVLGYPVISDELNLIIRKTNDTGSVHELTDKMFSKLDPFLREGVLMNVKKIESPEAAENAMQQVKDNFGPRLEMATYDGLVRAGKMQNVLLKEMKDHEVATSYMEMAKPDIKAAVDSTMNWLQGRGSAAKGVVRDDILLRYMMYRASVPGRNTPVTYGAIAEIEDKFRALTESEKPWPHLVVVDRYTRSVVYPMIKNAVVENIEEYRQNNPQLSKCGSTVFAATVVGSVKAEVKSMVKQYLTTMEGSGSSDVTDTKAAFDYVLEATRESLQNAVEEEAMDQGTFDTDTFMNSEAFEDINLQVESSIQSIVIKELQKSSE